MARIAVIGGRSRNDKEFIFSKLKEYIQKDDCILSGGADGVDRMAEEYAYSNGLAVIVYPPDYQRYHSEAPKERNKIIANVADVVIAFPAEDSKGTWHTVKLAKKLGKKVVVYESTPQ